MRRAIVAVAVAITALVAGGCSLPEPSPSQASWPPILDSGAAIEAAARVAQIGGPLRAVDVLPGTFASLDPEAHNAPGDPATAARRAQLAGRAVWRIELAGPNGRETLVLDAETGELLGAVTEGS
jgi:hypothetical protein